MRSNSNNLSKAYDISAKMKDRILNESICNTKIVCGTFSEVGGSKSDAIQYNLFIDKQSAFNNVALWSNPAWLNTDEKSICTKIASEWVYHNRIWMAIDRTTIAEVISSVRCIIPCSKLAKYGDYRYDLDIEALYDNLEETKPEISNDGGIETNYDPNCSWRDCEIAKYEQKEKMQGKLQIDCPSSSCIRTLVNQRKPEKQIENCDRPELDEWLLKWRDFLTNVRLTIGGTDSWTDTLLKVCYRFLTSARVNQSLIQLLEEEMPMIMDNKQLCIDPIQMSELLSLPQPYLEESLNLDSTETDALWLQLSSGAIRKLWPKNDATEKIFPNTDYIDVSAGALNFLRRRRNKFAKKAAYAEVEISEDEAKQLLGSLINLIEGFNSEMDKNETPLNTSDTKGGSSVNTLSETHRDRTNSMPFNGYNAPASITTNIIRESIPQIFNQSTYTLSIPVPNCILAPPNLRMSHSNLSIPSLTLPAQQFVFQPNIVSMPTLQAPIYYIPTTHYVRREDEYYTKCRQRLSSNVLDNKHKVPEQPFTKSSVSLHSSLTPEHVMVTRNCNQQRIRHSFQTGKSTVFPKQHGYSISFQKNVSVMPTQSVQVLRPVPLKLEKSNLLHSEYFYNEIIKSRILQNISNRTLNTKLSIETSSCHPSTMYYKSSENPVLVAVKENGKNKYLDTKGLLNQPIKEDQLTNEKKIRKEFPLVSVQKSTVNPLFQYKKRKDMMYKKITFTDMKKLELEAILLQTSSSKDQQIKMASNSKVSFKMSCKYFTQKWISYNCRIYKTKFFKRESIVNFKLELKQQSKRNLDITAQRRNHLKEAKMRNTPLKKAKFSSKFLSSNCKSKAITQRYQLFKKNLICEQQNRITMLKANVKKNDPKHLSSKNDFNDQNSQSTNCDYSFHKNDAQSSIQKGKLMNQVTAEYLNDITNYLLFDDENDEGKFFNANIQKISGWIHFKIAMLEIITRASCILNEKNNKLKII